MGTEALFNFITDPSNRESDMELCVDAFTEKFAENDETTSLEQIDEKVILNSDSSGTETESSTSIKQPENEDKTGNSARPKYESTEEKKARKKTAKEAKAEKIESNIKKHIKKKLV